MTCVIAHDSNRRLVTCVGGSVDFAEGTTTGHQASLAKVGQTVTLVQATKPWHGCGSATCIRVLWFTIRRCSLCEREMCSVVVVVKDVLIQQAFQMPFIQDNHMVEQIPAAVANPTLGNTVLPWTSETGPLWPNAKALHCVDDFLIEICALIEDQVARRGVIGECLAQLLDNPGAAMLRHIAVENSPPIMGNDEEAIKHAEGDRRYCEEVHRGDGFPMIAQKGRPSLCRFPIPRRLPHPAKHGPFRNVEAKHP